jgi:DNA replication protein DnaC
MTKEALSTKRSFSSADRSRPRRLAELVRPALLILDDFATRELAAQQADDLYEPTPATRSS